MRPSFKCPEGWGQVQRRVATKVSSKAFEDTVQEKIGQEVERHLSLVKIEMEVMKKKLPCSQPQLSPLPCTGSTNFSSSVTKKKGQSRSGCVWPPDTSIFTSSYIFYYF